MNAQRPFTPHRGQNSGGGQTSTGGAVRQHVLITDEEPDQKAFYEALGFSQFGEAMPGRTFVRFGG